MDWAGNVIARKIRVLGREVTVKGTAGKVTARAIIDPVSSISEKARTASSLADGYYPPGSYQYFGPPEVDLSDAEMVMDGEACYHIRRTELYQVGDQKLYWWALMIRGGTDDE